MKKIKLIFALFVSIFCLYSCDSMMNNDTQTEIDLASKEISISESAIDAVLSFVKEVYPQKYKTLSLTKEALKPEFVTNVSFERNKFFAPSEDNMCNEIDTLLSVINFGNNEGFAIVSTKDNQILAVTESGDLSVEELTMEYSDEDFGNNPKAVISNYVSNYIIGPTIPVGPVIPTDSINFGYVVRGPWVTETQIHPLVQIKLGQDAPYNKYCITSTDDTVYTGCAPIAIIQMMSANQYPNTIGGVTYNWNTIINRYQTYVPAQDVLAYWIRNIGGQCAINYYYYNDTIGSACGTESIQECIASQTRYTNVSIIDNPDYDDAYSMLVNRTPLLFIGGAFDEEEGDTAWHVWVVDGCIYQKQNVQLYDSNDELTGEYYEMRNYVHCNWGWYGNYDGYYITNIFNLRNGAPIPDEGTSGSGSSYKFNINLHAIKYDFE